MPFLKKLYSHHTVRLLIVFLSLITAYSTIAGLVFNISLINILANIYLQFFITFIPGLAFFTAAQKKKRSWLNIFAISYALGYSINIVEYFLLMPFGLGEYLRFFAPVISLLLSLVLIKKTIDCPPLKLNRFKEIAPVFLFLLMVAADFVIYSGTNVSPLKTGSSSYYRDIQFWVNTTVGLFLNFPPQAPYLSGHILNYHYFSNIQVAFSCLASNIDIFTLSFPLYPFTKSLLLIGGLNYLLDTFKATNFQKTLLIIAILFSTGLERISIVTNFHHFHLAPFGLDISFAFGAFFIASITESFQESDTPANWPAFLITMMFYAVATGSKAPLAAMLSIYPAILCISWLLRKKFTHAFAYGIGILLLFLVINFFCVGTFSVVNNLSNAQNLQLSPLKDLQIFDKFSSIYVNVALSILYKSLAAQPILMLLFFGACIEFIADAFKMKINNDQTIINAGLISTTIISILSSQIIHHAGNSQMYFMMAAYIPMAALGIEALTMLRQPKSRFVKMSAMAILMLVLAAQVYFFMFSAWVGYSAAKSIKEGFKNISTTGDPLPDDSEIAMNSIQKSDVEGLIWIRENTPKDAIIAVDRATFSADNNNQTHYFNYAMFAERQMFVEGTSMLYVLRDANEENVAYRQQVMKALYNNSTEAYETIKAEGIDYIIQTTWITPQFEPCENYSLIHSTNSMNIFIVNK